MPEKSKISEMKSLVLSLPEEPGVYQFYGKNEELIYVGKAKNIRKRVGSYFIKKQAGKTLVMRNRIVAIRHIVVDNESEALLLENNLIKKHQPRYNVLMKDDKTYPWICIKKEPFPRVFMTRNIIRDGSEYFGPYTSVVMVKTLLELIRQLYKLRTCKLKLSRDKIDEGRYRVCLEYHIGNCLGPCVDEQDEDDYAEAIGQIRDILKGNIYSVTRYLRKLMKEYSLSLEFEKAQAIKDKIEILDKYRARSTVVNPRISDVDVFAYTEDKSAVYVNYMRVIKGAIVQTYTLEIKRRIEEDMGSLMSLAITELRQIHSSDAREVIVPLMPDIKDLSIKYTVPRKGDKLRLIELAERNAVYFRINRNKRIEGRRTEDRSEQALKQIQRDLRLPSLPVHIECFDNSNIQGSNPVAACVVFRNGKASRKEYRHFNIKTVVGPDDFASMEEVIFRRYRRLIDEDESLPQLIIIDGGKGQLNSALKGLDELSLRGKISIVGIAKKLEEIYFPGDSVPLYIDKNSISLKIIQQLRNEAHRFGINFHRDKRSKSMLVSKLDEIPGVGPIISEQLLKKFGSVEKIRKASPEELEKTVGKAKSRKILEFFKNQS